MNENFNRIDAFLKHLTHNCKYSLIEKAEENSDLIEIAKARGYILPSFDLAPFKCIYAMIDKENKNGCTLPKEEISELALNTLIGKPINFDHVQRKIVGHWIDAKVDGEKIVAYGLFFKSALKDDYDMIKELMEKGNLKISYEAHINRLYTTLDEKHYTAKDVEFAGGALLILTNPAVVEAQVLELASTMTEPIVYLSDDFELEYSELNPGDRVTEDYIRLRLKSPDLFDKKTFRTINLDTKKGIKAVIGILKDSEDKKTTLQNVMFSKEKWTTKEAQGWMKKNMKEYENSNFEEARFFEYDMDSIRKMINQCTCPTCDKEGMTELDSIDFENANANVKCFNCGAKFNIDLKPKAKLIKAGKRPEEKNSLPMVAERSMEEYSMEELMKKLKEGLSTELATVLDALTVELKKESDTKVSELSTKLAEKDGLLEAANKLIDQLKSESNDAKIKIESMVKEISTKVEEAKVFATKVAGLKSELGDFVKDFKDEDFASESKVELARKNKEIARLTEELATKSKETASTALPAGKVAETASTKKEEKKETAFEIQSRINKAIYG